MAYSEQASPRTVDNIVRRLDVGSILIRRWLACWIDLIVLAVCLFGPVLLLSSPKIQQWGGMLGAFAVLAYFPVAEGLWGRTVGKLVAGLVVVDARGRPPGLLRAAGRTVTRLVEVNPFLLGGVPAGVIVLMNKRRRRLGDMLAGTYVIPKSELAQIERAAASSADAAAVLE